MNLDDLFRGPPTRAKWEMLGRYLKGQRVIGGVGVRISRDATHGTVISARQGSIGTGTQTGDSCAAFQLVKSAANKFTVSESTVGGLTPTGFTDGKKEFTVATADGKVYAKLTISSDGDPVSATIEQSADVPPDTDTVFHRLIGTFHVEGTGASAVLSLTQSDCGPFTVAICRNWFASEAPYYGLSWQ